MSARPFGRERAIALLAMGGAPAMADHATGYYSSTLGQLNGTTGTGTVTVDVQGTQATVNLTVNGLAETFMDGPYPHVQHIHGGAQGVCPTPENDENGDRHEWQSHFLPTQGHAASLQDAGPVTQIRR